MHRPGYVQGGQEVGRDYLLLRIHVRRIRGTLQYLYHCWMLHCRTRDEPWPQPLAALSYCTYIIVECCTVVPGMNPDLSHCQPYLRSLLTVKVMLSHHHTQVPRLQPLTESIIGQLFVNPILIGWQWEKMAANWFWSCSLHHLYECRKLTFGIQLNTLKGLSYEIDFENVNGNWQILALKRAAAGFWIIQRHLWFLVEIKHLLSGKC